MSPSVKSQQPGLTFTSPFSASMGSKLGSVHLAVSVLCVRGQKAFDSHQGTVGGGSPCMRDCLYFGENIQVDRYVWVQASHIASALPKTVPREEPGSS